LIKYIKKNYPFSTPSCKSFLYLTISTGLPGWQKVKEISPVNLNFGEMPGKIEDRYAFLTPF